MPLDLAPPPQLLLPSREIITRPAILRAAEPWKVSLNEALKLRGADTSKRRAVIAAVESASRHETIRNFKIAFREIMDDGGIKLALVPGMTPFPVAALADAPVIVGTPAVSTFNSPAASHNFNLPGSIVAGETILLYCGAQDNVTGDWDSLSGWVQIGDILNNASQGNFAVYRRVADGSEGATVTVNKTGSTTRAAGVAFRISGAGTIGAINLTESFDNAGPTTAPIPPTKSAIDTAKNSLWLTAMNTRHNNDPADPAGYPTGYAKVASAVGTTATGSTVAVAQKTTGPVAGESPGNWTIGTSSHWTTNTINVQAPV